VIGLLLGMTNVHADETQASCVDGHIADPASRISLFLCLGFPMFQVLFGYQSPDALKNWDVSSGDTFALSFQLAAEKPSLGEAVIKRCA
jgi:hypothetical protein